AREVEGERVRPLGHRKEDTTDLSLHFEVLARLPLPIRQLAQTLAQALLRLGNKGGAGLINGCRSVFRKQRDHALFRYIVAGDHGTQIEGANLGIANYVEQSVPYIPAQAAAIDELDAGRGKSFRENVLGVRGKTAGIHGADIGNMHEARAPGD